jgi:hypothetical protein
VRLMKQIVPEYISNNSSFQKLDKWSSPQPFKSDSQISIF